MNDKELADKVVALGVGGYNVGNYWIDPDDDATGWLPEEDFVRDWYVAGALIEMCNAVEVCFCLEEDWQALVAPPNDCYDLTKEVRNNSAPRAIIEACVEALCE